uniref:Uncharacterized protein n=1 Tax=Panagrolaimus sp. ES5 TaxID=591445 RepID=A0AC34GUL8_9BILA
MENFDVFCVQFVVQSIERISNDPGCSVIESIILKFGEQTVCIDSKPIIFEDEQKYASIKKGKICFCEKEQLGFEIILKLQKGYASNQISFISFEDKKVGAVFYPLGLSRHLLKNLGRQIETESIGIQATPRLRNNRAQTSTVSKSNVAIQTSKKNQKLTVNSGAVEMKEVSTQTDFPTTKSFSIVEERRALMKLIVLLVCKISTRINGSRIIRPAQTAKLEMVEEIPPEPVDLHAAQQFSNLRKKQIEQMRERLHQMAEERKEILELTNAKIGEPQKKAATVIPKHGIGHQPHGTINKKPDIAAFLEPTSTSKIIQNPNPPVTSSIVEPSTNYTSAVNPSFEFSTDKERIILSSDMLSPPTLKHQQQQQLSPSDAHPQTPTPTTTTLEPRQPFSFSRQESILSSIHSQAASEGELEELPSPVQSSIQSPIHPPPLRRKSYTLAETSQESVKSGSNFLEPSIFVPQHPHQHKPKRVEIREPERQNTPIPPPKMIKDKSESSNSATISESTEASSASESSENLKTSSNKSSTASSTASESSASTSSDSTLKKKKPSSPSSSSSSSTLGEGSVSTEESIQEEIPEAIDSDAGSVKDVSSISEASFSK